MAKLGLNIDHVATVREARRDVVPNILQAAREGVRGGAKGITVHLREDRRHIQDNDVIALKRSIKVPLNLEMSVAPEIVRFCMRTAPQKACLVPERRQELTTEGGLDVKSGLTKIRTVVSALKRKKVCVSLFIDPDFEQVQAAFGAGAEYVEFHTGSYAHAAGVHQRRELARLVEAARFAHELGIRVNAGHGLNYENVKPIAELPYVEELNIGHSIIARSIFTGLRAAVCDMVKLISTRSR